MSLLCLSQSREIATSLLHCKSYSSTAARAQEHMPAELQGNQIRSSRKYWSMNAVSLTCQAARHACLFSRHEEYFPPVQKCKDSLWGLLPQRYRHLDYCIRSLALAYELGIIALWLIIVHLSISVYLTGVHVLHAVPLNSLGTS